MGKSWGDHYVYCPIFEFDTNFPIKLDGTVVKYLDEQLRNT